eukprot:TRINITY_DN5500_c0_g1_i1.p1 TRINITY_DN5500_c0_g1~~TRINITY_DN5500_c0_g1_i1.p1  ORF type:complete len:481 (-),score=182.94 TRINITY_DN5500_c0_g1_i1:37-1479(-)
MKEEIDLNDYDLDISKENNKELLKKIIRKGNGDYPEKHIHMVRVLYTKRLSTGEVLESCQDRDNPYVVGLNRGEVIRGFDVGLATMSKGEIAKFKCLPNYSYGYYGQPPKIPSNSIILLDVEVLDYHVGPPDKGRMKPKELLELALKEKELGNKDFINKDVDGALKHYEEVMLCFKHIHDEEDKKPGLETLKSTNLNMAACFLLKKDYEKALYRSNEVIYKDANNAKALYRRSQAQLELGEIYKAKDDIIKAIKLAPNDKNLRLHLDQIHIRTKEENKNSKQFFGSLFKNATNGSLYEETKTPYFWEGPNPKVFLEITIGEEVAGKMIIELYADKVPRTAINFRSLCTGEKGEGAKNTLHYLSTFIHKVEKGFGIYGGDTEHKYGLGGESIYGSDFDNEGYHFKHDSEGVLTMVNNGKQKNTSLFMITCRAAPELDDKQVVFGKVIEGLDVLKKIENSETKSSRPVVPIRVSGCGAVENN